VQGSQVRVDLRQGTDTHGDGFPLWVG
jgi:hypothetical protein